MLTTAYVKITVALNASVEDLPQDVMVFGVAARLEATELLPLRAVSKVMNKLATADDIWFNKLTVLTLQYPALSNMDQGAGESAFVWYARCACAICSGSPDSIGWIAVSGACSGGRHPSPGRSSLPTPLSTPCAHTLSWAVLTALVRIIYETI